jgi:hypothetical protein
MSWKNLTASTGTNGSSGKSSDFYKLQAGATRIRIVAEPVEMRKAFVNQQFITQYAGMQPIQGAVFSTKYLLWAINRATSEVKLFEFGKTIMEQIATLAASDEYRFNDMNPMPYDITITKRGEKTDTVYTVMPARDATPLTEEEMSQVRALKSLEEVKLSLQNAQRTKDGVPAAESVSRRPVFNEDVAGRDIGEPAF